MNEGETNEPAPVLEQEIDPLLETAKEFTSDEAEGFKVAIESRADQEAARPGLMKRMTTSAKARMAMTIVAATTAMTLGGVAESGAAERRHEEHGRGKSGRTISEILRVAQGVMIQQSRQRAVLEQQRGAAEERGAERARAQAHEAERAMRDAEYKLRGIEAELPRTERQLKTAQYKALKLAATDEGAKQVRTIMLERTAVKMALWKASYEGAAARVEELSRKDRQLEESLLPHLSGRIAQQAGDLFVNTIIPGELKILDLEGKQEYLREAMGLAGDRLSDAMGRFEAHAERAQRAYDQAAIGIRAGYGR